MDKPSSFRLDRRGFLAGGTATLAAGLMPRRAFAQSGDLIVSNWGGDWNDNIVAAFEQPAFGNSGVSIIHDLAPVPERKARLVAQRNLPRGSVDVSWLSGADAFEMNQAGVLEELDFSLIPNSSHLSERLKSPYYVPAVFGGVVILYNPQKITVPPTSFEDLWKPEYAGRVGLMDQIYFNYIYAASLLAGGTMSNVEPAFEKLLALKAAVQPRIYPSHQALAAAFQTEEIWISANYNSRGLQWKADGSPLEIAFPREGAIAISFGASIVKRAPNREAGYAYLNEMIAPTNIAGIARATYYAVSTDNAALESVERASLEFTEEQISAMNFVDFAYAAENDSRWLEWWNRDFKA